MSKIDTRRFARLSSVAAVLFLVSCSSPGFHGGKRQPASDLPPAFADGLMTGAQRILTHVSAPDFNSDNCVGYLQEIEGQIDQIQPREAPVDEIQDHSGDLVNLLWQIRLTLHKRLPEFSAPCVTEIRNTARLFRFIEDFLAERAGKITEVNPDSLDFQKQEVPVLANVPYYLTLTNPEFGGFEFKNGDVMVARGTSFLSAIISRVGDVSSQFSHVILVHVDKDTHKVETIESYVGPGVGVYDLDWALKNENVRLLLLRPKDQEMASKAADFMYARAKAALASGHPIQYDYNFDFKDHKTMSCAEVAEAAYEEGSDGKIIVPQYPSTISENPKFLGRINMKPGETFTPGDLEVDPRFDMVMEWRDLRLTRDERVKDSILTSMLNWVNEDKYQLHDTGTSNFAGAVIWRARKTFLWPLVQKMLHVAEFPNGIPQNMFKTVVLLNQVGTVFLNHVKAQDQAFEQQTGWSMTYQDLYKSLEDYRAQDFALWKNKKTRKKSEFHFAFHP